MKGGRIDAGLLRAAMRKAALIVGGDPYYVRVARAYDELTGRDSALCGDPDPKHPGRSCTIATGHGGTRHGNDHYEWESA